MREKIICVEDPVFTKDYHDPTKRSIANALTVEFKDGKKLKEVVVEYPIGILRRRKDGIPLLVEKIQDQFGATVSSQAAKGHSGRVTESEEAGSHAGE